MNDAEPELAEEARPGRRPAQRKGVLTAKVLLTSSLINGLIVLFLFLVVFPPPRPNPPSFEVSLKSEEKEPDDFDNLKIEKLKRPIDSGQTSSGMMKPIVAPVSAVSIAVPEFATATSGEVPGMNLGIGPGNGTGYGLGGNGRGGGSRAGSVGGMKVKAARLGVVLDVSGSMKDKLPKVRRELRKEFANATVVEVTGCSLTWKGEDEPFDLKKARETLKISSRANSVLEAVELLIAAKRVDAIFWFSDLRDSQTAEGLRRLSVLLGTTAGSGRRPVRFYVQSVGRSASTELKEIVVRSSGGAK